MAYSNGEIPTSALAAVDGVYLAVPQSRAWKRAQKVLRTRYPTAHILGPWGGYRPKNIQAAMRSAYLSHDQVQMKRLGMSTVSRATPAPAGYSPHGMGIALDLGGAPINQWVLDTMRTFGWTRQFGPSDPNHFWHDGKTATGVFGSKKVYYVVRKGDTLSKIAGVYKTSWQNLAKLNKLKDPSLISIGQRLRVR